MKKKNKVDMDLLKVRLSIHYFNCGYMYALGYLMALIETEKLSMTEWLEADKYLSMLHDSDIR